AKRCELQASDNADRRSTVAVDCEQRPEAAMQVNPPRTYKQRLRKQDGEPTKKERGVKMDQHMAWSDIQRITAEEAAIVLRPKPHQRHHEHQHWQRQEKIQAAPAGRVDRGPCGHAFLL